MEFQRTVVDAVKAVYERKFGKIHFQAGELGTHFRVRVQGHYRIVWLSLYADEWQELTPDAARELAADLVDAARIADTFPEKPQKP